MNEKRFLLIILVLGAMAFMTGCEFDVAQPKWEEPFVNPPTPAITQIVPADVAPPGANTITILGENFDEGADRNWVYFDEIEAEMVSATATSIVVRRPNLVADSCLVKVSPRAADTVAVFFPYEVTSVWDQIGVFPENNQLNDLTVDENGNVYVFQNSPRSVFKIAPDGTTTTLLEESAKAVIDAKWAKIGGQEKILLLMDNRSINQLDLTVSPPVESEWIKVAKRVSYGDFDSYGNFYSAGSRTDLVIVTAGMTEKPLLGIYSKDDIKCVRVFDGYVYLVVTLASPAEGEPEIGIWRHPILDENGSLGTREPVLDWSTTGSYAQSTIRDITFSQDGIMYVATDNDNPIFMLHPDGSQDVLYKTILPTYSAQIAWGAGNALFMLLGGDEWTVVQIQMGAPGAPYYGRAL